MAFIGNQPISIAFLTDTFSGTGAQVAFTMTVAPANTSSIIVAVTGVVQDPSTYSVSGTTLTFSAAPPSGTSNISVRYLGIPASGVTTTAYRTVTNTTATASQTSFTIPSYTVGYVDVYRNGVYLPTTDYTATTGTTVVLNTGATSGDTITTISFYVSSVLNAIPATAASISSTYLASNLTITTPTIDTITSAASTALTLKSAGTTALTIDTSQRAAFVAGTAALPAITTTGDTNTGIFFPAADTIAFSDGGAEVMRLDSSGFLLYNTTSTTVASASTANTGGINFRTSGAAGNGVIDIARTSDFPLNLNRLSTTGGIVNLIYNGASIGTISTNGTNAAYNTSSDYRLKENIAPMTGALAKVAQLNPVTYKWKKDQSDGEGFIAHELAEVMPHAVTGAKDAVDKDGNPEHQGVDVSFLVATLTAAIQELKAELDAVKTELATLRGLA